MKIFKEKSLNMLVILEEILEYIHAAWIYLFYNNFTIQDLDNSF